MISFIQIYNNLVNHGEIKHLDKKDSDNHNDNI